MVDQRKRNFPRERESFVGNRSLTISTIDLNMSFISWCYSCVYVVLYGKRQFSGGIKIMDSHGDPTSLAPHERLTDLAVVPREKPNTGAAAREQPRDSPVIER